MTTYRVRLTWSANVLRPFFEELECERVFAVEHTDGKRIHCHALLEGVKMTTEGMKQRLRKITNSKPAKDMWSFPEGIDDVASYLLYCLKGQYIPFYVRGVFDQDLDKLRTDWVQPEEKGKKAKIQYKIRVENPVQAKARQADLMDQVMKRYIENEKKGLIEIIRQVVYVEHKTIVGRYKIRDYVDYVRAHTHAKTWVETMETFCQFKE